MALRNLVVVLLVTLVVPSTPGFGPDTAAAAPGPSTGASRQGRTLTTAPYTPPAERLDAAAAGWSTVVREDFEGTFPSGLWTSIDNDAPPLLFGEYCWRSVAYQPYRGARSAWPAAGCLNALNPATSNYPNLANSWMIYGPFSLTGASAAFVDVKAWTQLIAPDSLVVAASTNGFTFSGLAFTGATSTAEPPTSEGWADLYLDLTAVPGLGNLTGQSQVWVAIIFQSDGFINETGPFVDEVRIEKRTAPASAIGGRNLRLSTGRPLAAGTSLLTWEKGTTETGYLVVRWSPVGGHKFFPANLVPFTTATTSFTDSGPLADEAYCYLVVALGGNPANVNNVLGLSDFLCVYPNTSSGTTAQNFAIDLRQSDVAGLSWVQFTDPVPFTRWEVKVSTFDGQPGTTVPLSSSTVSYSSHTAGVTTCYQLVTSNVGGSLGQTNKVCAVPAIATLKQGASLMDAVRQLAPARP